MDARERALAARRAAQEQQKTSVEFGGVTFTGGKMFALITALSTLGGAAWGGFEFYNDYRNMKEQIESYVAPDLSGFQEQMSVLEQKMKNVELSVEESRSYTRDIKNDNRKDIDRLEAIVEATEDRTKKVQTESFAAIRNMETQVREMIDIADDRYDNKRDALQLDTERKLKDLEERMENTIQRALDNPLAQ